MLHLVKIRGNFAGYIYKSVILNNKNLLLCLVIDSFMWKSSFPALSVLLYVRKRYPSWFGIRLGKFRNA
jgi:hypothetical protein